MILPQSLTTLVTHSLSLVSSPSAGLSAIIGLFYVSEVSNIRSGSVTEGHGVLGRRHSFTLPDIGMTVLAMLDLTCHTHNHDNIQQAQIPNA